MQVYIPDQFKNDDDLKRATRWVSGELTHSPGENANEVIEEAVHRFNLTLMEAEVINIMFADMSKRQVPTTDPWANFVL